MKFLSTICILALAVVANLSCTSPEVQNADSQSATEQNANHQEPEEKSLPFSVSISKHGFVEDRERIEYLVEGEITNDSDKNFTKSGFKRPYGDIETMLYIEFDDNYIHYYSSGHKVENYETTSLKSFYDGFLDDEPSMDNPWKPSESKKFSLQYGNPSGGLGLIKPIHFSYEPKRCEVIISMYASDPVGYEISGSLIHASVSDDWNSYKGNLLTIATDK